LNSINQNQKGIINDLSTSHLPLKQTPNNNHPPKIPNYTIRSQIFITNTPLELKNTLSAP